MTATETAGAPVAPKLATTHPASLKEPAALEVRNLKKHFVAKKTLLGRPLATVKAVDGVSFRLAEGETLAIVGESGCGKSTIGRLLMRLDDPTDGEILLDGADVARISRRGVLDFRRHVQLIFQDPFASLNPRMTVGQILAEPLMLHDIVPAAQRRERVAELMRMVGLRPGQASRYPHEFSGGQRQRVAIARALAVDPKIIICDEAVSALDVSIQAQILNLLKDLQARFGLAYIFISHDLGVVKHIADRVAVMYLGRFVEVGPSEAVFADPRHPYTRALLSAIPVAATGGRKARRSLSGDVPSPIDPPSGCRLRTRCPHARDACRQVAMALEPDEAGHANACEFWRELPPEPDLMPEQSSNDPRLERLFAAFNRPAAAAPPGPAREEAQPC